MHAGRGGRVNLSRFRFGVVVLPVLLLLGLLCGGWEAYVRYEHVNEVILPPPSRIGKTLWADHSTILSDLWVTLLEIVYGFLVGFGLGIVSGILIVYSKVMERTLYPLVIASQVIPIFAIAPLLIIWFGFGIKPKVIIAAIIVFFPICVNMVEGLRSADQGIIDVMRSYGASGWKIFRSIRLPASIPYLLVGTQVGITFSVIGAVIAEWVGADKGLGYRMIVANSQSETDLVFAAIVALAVVGVGLFALVRVVGDFVFPWQAKQRTE
jgi:ABC-type nitrate/sulfonate/bicarbonate transport system permease component